MKGLWLTLASEKSYDNINCDWMVVSSWTVIEADGVLGSNVVADTLQGLELVGIIALAMSEVAVDIPA